MSPSRCPQARGFTTRHLEESSEGGLLLLRNMRVLHDPDELRDFRPEESLELLRPAADRLVGPSAQPLQHVGRMPRLRALALDELDDVARRLRRREPGLPAR